VCFATLPRLYWCYIINTSALSTVKMIQHIRFEAPPTTIQLSLLQVHQSVQTRIEMPCSLNR
uniref:Uncharacterized protein n=1 Tax=Oryza brachyantha TaxID=4533 RepID=J3M2Z2_ORYBR